MGFYPSCIMKRYRFLVIVLFIPTILLAEYRPIELFTIPWGDGANELKIAGPTINGIISDSTDYDIDPGYGPTETFVDARENVIVISYEFNQIKGFNNHGKMIFNFSRGETIFDPDICRGQPDEIYVDSLLNIYITSYPWQNFVPVVNYNGKVVRKLYPYKLSGASIMKMAASVSGKLTFLNLRYGPVTYFNGQFKPGGTALFIANDGFHYAAYANEMSDKLTFDKATTSDTLGTLQKISKTETLMPADSAWRAELLYSGDGNSLYAIVNYFKGSCEFRGVWIYSLDYKLIDELPMAKTEGKYDLSIDPFVARDGSIYEFRVQDDGLHVIKWTKK
jgi:hypothetical protein